MKKIAQILLSFILIILMMFLTVSFTFNKVIVDGIIKETIISKIPAKKVNEGNIDKALVDQVRQGNYSNIPIPDYLANNEDVQKLLESKEGQGLINQFINTTISGITSEEDLKNIDIEKDIVNFVTENKDVIERITGKEITNEMIEDTKSQLQEQNVNSTIQETIKNTKNSMTKTQKTVLKGYTLITSTKTKVITFILILLDLLLIALLQKSLYKWINTLSKCAIISGLGIVLMSVVIKVIVTNLINFKNFNIKTLLVAGVIQIVVGVVGYIVYKLTTKKLIKKED